MSPHRKCKLTSLDGNLDTRKGLLFQATSSKVYAEPSRRRHKQQALGEQDDAQFLFCRLDNAKYNALTLSLNLYSFLCRLCVVFNFAHTAFVKKIAHRPLVFLAFA